MCHNETHIELTLCVLTLWGQMTYICYISRCDGTFVALCSTDKAIGGPRPSVPVDDFYELIYLMNNNALDGYGMDISRSGIKKFNSKNMGTFQCNPFSIKAVIPFILLACLIHCHSVVTYGRREKPVAMSFRDKVSHTTQRDVYMLFISDS